ncbi:MAG: HAMP domain-containing histidine kinase [Anaerolineaceae bacterium]|nr:HAMP domain-containing histidine kinase [Anaerolineaceae bacterium]
MKPNIRPKQNRGWMGIPLFDLNMTKKYYQTWFLCLLPLLIGLGVAGIAKARFVLFPVLQLRIDLGSCVILLGLFLSILVGWIRYREQIHQHQLEQLLDEEANEHKQFLLRLDHELKNPLSTIRTGVACCTQLISNEVYSNLTLPNSELQQTMAQIDHQTQRISRLINDLGKLAELETCPLENTAVDINLLLEELVSDMQTRPDAKERGIHLSVPSAPWQLPDIRADEDLLYLSIRNLLDNAIKYTDTNDTIEIRALENRDHILIEIADSGIGIPEDEIKNVWGKLYRAKNSRGIPGNGLGLSIVRIIIKRLNGECDLRSRDGRGTIITLQLSKSKDS